MRLELPPRNQHPGKFSCHKYCKSEDVNFSRRVIKVSCALRVGASHGKGPSGLVWSQWVLCKWIYDVFNLSYDLTRPPHRVVVRIYGWELLTVCHHLIKFSSYRHCDSGDIMFRICHVASGDHIFRRLCEFMGGSPSR